MTDRKGYNESKPKEDAPVTTENVTTEKDKGTPRGSDGVLRSQGTNSAADNVKVENEDAQTTTEHLLTDKDKGIPSGSDRVVRSEGATTADDNVNGEKAILLMDVEEKANRQNSQSIEEYSIVSCEGSCNPIGSSPVPSAPSRDTTESSPGPSEPSCAPMNSPQELKKPMLDRGEFVIEDEARKQKVDSWEAGNIPKRRKKSGIEMEKLALGGSGRSLSARAESEEDEIAGGNTGVDGSEANEIVKWKKSTAAGTIDVRIEAPNRGDNSDVVKAVTLASVEIELVESDEENQKEIESEKGNSEENQEREEHYRLDREYFNSLPPGYRFSPTGLELLEDYLKKKIRGFKLPRNMFFTDDVYGSHPQLLTGTREPLEPNEWYFFSPRNKKGNVQTSRCAGYGFWKATRANENIFNNEILIGKKQMLIYYEGTAKNPKKTHWHMDEYKYTKNDQIYNWVVCKIFKKTIAKEAIITEYDYESQALTEGSGYPIPLPKIAAQGQNDEGFLYLTKDVLPVHDPFSIPGSCESSHIRFSDSVLDEYLSEASGDHIHRESTAGGTTDVRNEALNGGHNSDEVEAATLASVENKEGEIVESDEENQKEIEAEKGNTEDGKGGGKSEKGGSQANLTDEPGSQEKSG